MINQVVLIGHLTKDPELRRTPKGDAVTSFTLAVNHNYATQDGKKRAYFEAAEKVSLKQLKNNQGNK